MKIISCEKIHESILIIEYEKNFIFKKKLYRRSLYQNLSDYSWYFTDTLKESDLKLRIFCRWFSIKNIKYFNIRNEEIKNEEE